MARNVMSQHIDRLVREVGHKPWTPLLMVLAMVVFLLSSAKAVGILLPYINSQLF